MDISKEWFVTTPVIFLIQDNDVLQSWGEGLPEFEKLMDVRFQAKNGVVFRSAFGSKQERRWYDM